MFSTNSQQITDRMDVQTNYFDIQKRH